jgi:hypothetical protein
VAISFKFLQDHLFIPSRCPQEYFMIWWCYSGYDDELVALKGTWAISRVPLRKDLFVGWPPEKTIQLWGVVWDALSWLIRGTRGVVCFAVVPSMGSGHSTSSVEARCRGSFVLLSLITPSVGRGTVFIKLEKPNERLWPLGNLCKSYIVKPCWLTLEVFKGLYNLRQNGIMSRG